MMEMFLTKDELVELTGRKQRIKQIKQLNQMQIPYTSDAFGWPKVLRRTVELELSSKESHSYGDIRTINYEKLANAGN